MNVKEIPQKEKIILRDALLESHSVLGAILLPIFIHYATSHRLQ